MSVNFKPPVTAEAASEATFGPLGPDAEGVSAFKGIANGLMIVGTLYLSVIGYFLL